MAQLTERPFVMVFNFLSAPDLIPAMQTSAKWLKQSSEPCSSGNLLAPLNAVTASGIRQRDVVLAVVDAEPSDSDTSHIGIISEPCKERF